MLACLEEYITNEDPVGQFVEERVEETNSQDFIPVQDMLSAIELYCQGQGLRELDQRLVRKRLRELLGPTIQRRFGKDNERTRGFAGYQIIEEKQDSCPF